MSEFTDMLDKMLANTINVAEQRFGPRINNRKILPILLGAGLPRAIPYIDGNIQVQVGLDCATNIKRACYQMAHETIHLLSFVFDSKASVLEEGLATHFAHSYIRDYLGMEYAKSGDVLYDAARSRVDRFLAAHPNCIRTLREREPIISRITSAQIREAYPDVSQPEAEALAHTFCDWDPS